LYGFVHPAVLLPSNKGTKPSFSSEKEELTKDAATNKRTRFFIEAGYSILSALDDKTQTCHGWQMTHSINRAFFLTE
jgi:hypothetical protein